MRPQCSVLYEYVSKERSGLFVLSLCLCSARLEIRSERMKSQSWERNSFCSKVSAGRGTQN
jgi:hypothetical protein